MGNRAWNPRAKKLYDAGVNLQRSNELRHVINPKTKVVKGKPKADRAKKLSEILKERITLPSIAKKD